MQLLAIVISGFALAILAPWLPRLLGRYCGWAIALLPLAIAAVLASRAGEVAALGAAITESYQWAPGLGLTLSFRLDGLSLLLSMLVSGIGALIFIYAGGYMGPHPHLGRLYSFLLMFMGSMLGLALADNLIALFIFWELTSISSYLLIGFDHSKSSSRKSALQALLVTGLGGLALLAGALLLGNAAGSMELSEILTRGDLVRESPYYTAIVLLFAFAAFTKSAQFPFHFWLPAAMAAPTPVSAYLHSSTMVKAGVYLLARLSPILGGTVLWSDLLTWVGATTMIVGAWMAFRQTVMKPLLAYSTVSALGTITMAIGVGTVGAIEAAMVFLLGHAFYKGALFMAAGAIDHETGEKDLQKLSGLRGAMPILFAATALASVSMAGIPPLVGFLGKELALKSLIPSPEGTASGWVLTGLFTLSAALGVAVAFRIGFGPFVGARAETPHAPHDPPPSMLAGPVALAGLGLAAALLPTVLAYPLVRPAASTVAWTEAHPKLDLWQGLNLALVLSVVAVGVGLGMLWRQRLLLNLTRPLAALDAVGPSKAYDLSLAGMMSLAAGQTRALQSGILRFYLFVTIGAAVILVGAALLWRGGPFAAPTQLDFKAYEAALMALVLLGAIVAATARTRLLAIAALGLVGYGVALIYVIYSAPDLAMTQIAIETLTVIIFVLVFYHLPDFRSISGRAVKIRDLTIALSGGAMMTGLVLMVTGLDPEPVVSDYFSRTAVPEGYGRNVVNVILVDFRALDTLGEIVVLAVAGVGVWSLLRLTMHKEGEKA